MSLYNYVIYVVTKLFGFLLSYPSYDNSFMLYPTNQMTSFDAEWSASYINQRGGFLFNAWQRVLSDKTVSWWNQIASDPRLIVSTIVWFICIWITVELCLILPYRWFKRLLRYPNHKLMTPQEVKRSKLK